MKLNIALEWFLNPDHLPFVAGIALGKYKQAGLEVNLIEPKEHYDGFEALHEGTIDIHVNEPLHLFEHYFDGIKSLGCFFETRGGVMIRADRVEKLLSGKKIKITTPASNDVTNKIGFEIIKRYGEKNNIIIKKEDVEFVQTDFYHIKNMQENIEFDGAWLCFYNFEGIEAELTGFLNLFIDQSHAMYPNFSALELMSTTAIVESKKEAIEKFIKITGEMATYLRTNPLEAKTIYYDYTKTAQSKLMDNIITDTLSRFEDKIGSDKERWRELYHFLEELELVKLTEQEYANIW
ncbi:MAG: ABC transporter substrate-binding protein [Sulfurimonadaceae bacterium]|jgi:ABC-type nitrate/sulfonate/bicarbonate transport system substrate-binding protein|nr:ABC transporter substrate-binding protein [Sulfurimonadaceae bacterium]